MFSFELFKLCVLKSTSFTINRNNEIKYNNFVMIGIYVFMWCYGEGEGGGGDGGGNGTV